MKKSVILLTVIFFASFVFSGCGGSVEKANTTTSMNSSEKTNTSAVKTDENRQSSLKPDDISPDRALKVIDLADAATADEAAWRDKEVSVSGYVWEGSGAAENIVTITNDEKAIRTTTVSCHLEGKKPEGLNDKTVELMGKISYVTKHGDSKGVNLKPCELKK